ncbi:hypothetical protein [Paraburkholderia susongensis]|uniref:hypothetical protein n=1 Tax=Paraburkholderia susongensis TaxID=1515439 RepID=UPI00117C5726|nr:hypothetical protein [Paraburkholderia susongensis]
MLRSASICFHSFAFHDRRVTGTSIRFLFIRCFHLAVIAARLRSLGTSVRARATARCFALAFFHHLKNNTGHVEQKNHQGNARR